MKTYRALLTQRGSDAPVATILENSLGNIKWAYVEEGIYVGELTNAFPELKTLLSQPATSGDETTFGRQLFFSRQNDNTLSLVTFNGQGQPENGLLNATGVEVVVYP